MINDGGPAFPVHGEYGDDDPRNHVLGGGMSLRDWFAGQALAGLASGSGYHPFTAADEAYRLADAMLAARAKGGAQ